MERMDNNKTVDDAVVVVDDAVVVVEPKTAKPRRRGVTVAVVPMPRSIKSIADLIAVGRNVTPANWVAVVGRFTGPDGRGGVSHASRNVGRFTGMRIVDFQNVWMADNNGLDDCQLAAIMRIEHPAASGGLYTRDAATAVGIVRGIRAEYNRNGHGSKTETWRTVRAERFGAASFAWPTTAVKTA
jgi:hypothetical protein